MKAVIIGAGIAGPAAALALASAGHEVLVMERRSPNDLWSDSTIAITTGNIRQLESLGMKLSYLPAGSLALNVDLGHGGEVTRSDWTTRFNIVIWGALHEALVSAGEKLGVRYLWRQNGVIPPADLVVHAQGVRYAAHHSSFAYAYRVYRGTLFGDADPYWLSLHTARKDVVLNIGSVGTQRSWMLYLHDEEDTAAATEVITGSRREALFARARDLLPEGYAEIVTSTRSEIQSSPVGDWTMPRLLSWKGSSYDDPSHDLHVDIGDAVAPVRPHTTAGANLGIAEGLSLPHGIAGGDLGLWEDAARSLREKEIARGKELGLEWMGR